MLSKNKTISSAYPIHGILKCLEEFFGCFCCDELVELVESLTGLLEPASAGMSYKRDKKSMFCGLTNIDENSHYKINIQVKDTLY